MCGKGSGDAKNEANVTTRGGAKTEVKVDTKADVKEDLNDAMLVIAEETEEAGAIVETPTVEGTLVKTDQEHRRNGCQD